LHGKKNGSNSPDFGKKKRVSRLPDFYDKFQQVAKNIERFCFVFPFSYLVGAGSPQPLTESSG
jgi:hypothetical protein